MAPNLSPPPQHAWRVRPARRGDGQAVVSILQEVGCAADSATYAWTISHPEMEVLVAADALDKVVGLVTLTHRPMLKLGGRTGFIDELAVTSSWRRKGVGKELLRRAVDRAKVLGVKRLDVQSLSEPDEGLVAFFLACGFTRAPDGIFRLR